jgi:hypothetical protein
MKSFRRVGRKFRRVPDNYEMDNLNSLRYLLEQLGGL